MFCQVLNAASDGVFKRKYSVEKIFNSKRILKRLCYCKKWKTGQKLLSNSGLEAFYARFCRGLNILFRGTKYCPQKGLCSNTLKSNELKMAHFRYTIWFMISKKSITRCTFLRRSTRMHQKFWKGIQKNCVPQFPMLSALKLPLCRLVFFIYMTTYILT